MGLNYVPGLQAMSEDKEMNKILLGLGMVAHTYNPRTLRGRGGRITCGQEFETSLANVVETSSLLKVQK